MPKVVKKGAGAELGRHREQALACFRILAERSRHPVTAKIRIVTLDDPAPTLELVRGLAALGARAVTIHGRIREAFYAGPVAFDIIRTVREALPGLQIIANGGVTSLEKYREMRRETGCDAVMLARGAMGNPWLFRELTDNEAYTPPTLEEWRILVERHIAGMVELYGETSAMCMARKVLHDYFRGRGFPGPVRAKISYLATWNEFREFLDFAIREHSESYWSRLASEPEAERRLRRSASR